MRTLVGPLFSHCWFWKPEQDSYAPPHNSPAPGRRDEDRSQPQKNGGQGKCQRSHGGEIVAQAIEPLAGRNLQPVEWLPAQTEYLSIRLGPQGYGDRNRVYLFGKRVELGLLLLDLAAHFVQLFADFKSVGHRRSMF